MEVPSLDFTNSFVVSKLFETSLGERALTVTVSPSIVYLALSPGSIATSITFPSDILIVPTDVASKSLSLIVFNIDSPSPSIVSTASGDNPKVTSAFFLETLVYNSGDDESTNPVSTISPVS